MNILHAIPVIPPINQIELYTFNIAIYQSL